MKTYTKVLYLRDKNNTIIDVNRNDDRVVAISEEERELLVRILTESIDAIIANIDSSKREFVEECTNIAARAYLIKALNNPEDR